MGIFGKVVASDAPRTEVVGKVARIAIAADQKASNVNWCSREMKVGALRRAELPARAEPL